MREDLREVLKKILIPVLPGGMGLGVTGWKIARLLEKIGGLGTISGVAIHVIIARQLQLGDPDGDLKRAFDAFPFSEVAERVYEKYFVPIGKKNYLGFRDPEQFSINPSRELIELVVVANFAEVFLAKDGHNGLVGINYLEKVQMPHIYSLFGAMLAGVDFVVVGAGIPSQFPLILENLVNRKPVEYKLDVTGAMSGEFVMRFDPEESFSEFPIPDLVRPYFLPIISSTVLGKWFAKKFPEQIDAFVIERPIAGGHNAPPRDRVTLMTGGEPLYGLKDEVNLEAIRLLGIPYFLAGGFAHPEKASEAIAKGAVGIQVGSIFQYSNESGLVSWLRSLARAMAFEKKLKILTSLVSPTGYPFKVAQIPGTLSEQDVYEKRVRFCHIRLLSELYKKKDGSLGYRCSAEPENEYVKKGGKFEICKGKVCLCNCLLANIGLPQTRGNGYVEPPLVTSGDDDSFLIKLMKNSSDTYGAKKALDYILGKK
ncbi:MAG: 2-nitropropane dioxygenase [Candidatus Moranbacteria bacterium CG10_big_fil_rev_8_21_14_0_10_35_21]|nr:MAG: 2-nitropropane dioxygenase [Candidatus Moranbacteria bacterium CG10_big_fil_rev_8_21_14_0_10_35_21]PJA88407.1 MAG: 2-nitropropane dioxygenase [Candidatus Moranbacteria bacterium CG_4_9_14_3_um_filter_36_9]